MIHLINEFLKFVNDNFDIKSIQLVYLVDKKTIASFSYKDIQVKHFDYITKLSLLTGPSTKYYHGYKYIYSK